MYENSNASAADDEDIRWFYCSDPVRGCRVPFYSESYSNEINISASEENRVDGFMDNESNHCNLFDFNIDRGTAVFEELDNLFKMAKFPQKNMIDVLTCFFELCFPLKDTLKFSYALEYATQTSLTNVAVSLLNRKNNDCILCRRKIVGFLIYLRSFIRRVSFSSRFKLLKENLLKKISEELGSFVAFCGHINSLPDNILSSTANEPFYHVFHCHLDVKWLHITLLLEGIRKQSFDFQEINSHFIYDTLELVLSNIVADLIFSALKRFRQTPLPDLCTTSVFTCVCVEEIWRLLQMKCDELNSEQRCSSFWSHVNRVCEEIITENDGNLTRNGTECSVTAKYNCPNPAIFICWLLKDLNGIHDVQSYTKIKSNYHLLDTSLELFLKTDESEVELRTVLILVENILKSNWEERTEPLTLLWEYFHKRMNSSFLVPGASIGEMAIIGKSASGILQNLTRKLESDGCEEYMDSFHLFLRLLGLKLKKWQENADGVRCWNQLKGRLLSKFSSSKFSTFNEIGLYHSILIFLTMAISADSHEMSEKLLMFLQLLHSQELNETRTKLTLQAHTALILLFMKRDRDISSISNTLLAMLEVIQNHSQNLKFMRIFIDEFNDLINFCDNLQLGQYTLIGNWIFQFLSSNCNESDRSRLLDSISLLITKLNSSLSTQLPVKEDCQLVLYGDALWKHLMPFLKTDCSTGSSSCQVSDVAASLTTYFLNISVVAQSKSRALDIFTLFTSRENVDAKILCRYVGQMCRSRCIYKREAFGSSDIILIRNWFRCVILLPKDENNQYLSYFTMYISSLSEMQHILPKFVPEDSLCVNDYFETFLNSLQSSYSSCEDSYSKNKLFNQISSYFTNADKWLVEALKLKGSSKTVLNIYENIGQMLIRVPHLLYTKSKSNSLLQNFLEVLLLSNDLRNPQTDVPLPIGTAINKTIHLYVRGLIILDPENDAYIERSTKELIATHIPRLTKTKVTIFASGIAETSLCSCFENSEYFEVTSKIVLEVVSNIFLKKRAKIPHRFAFPALAFLESVIKQYQNDDRVVISYIRNVFDRLCDTVMFCETSNPSRGKARNIVHLILKSNSARNNISVSQNIVEAFGKLCREHLAFTSRNLFDLFEDIVRVAPDLVLRFLPQFTNEIKQVENKRGVGYDRALRNGLGRIEDIVKSERRMNPG